MTTRNLSGNDITKRDLILTLSAGAISFDDLRDLMGELPDGKATMNIVQKYPRKVKPLARTSQTTDQQTDGFAMPLAKRNVVTHVWLKNVSYCQQSQ